MRKRVLTFLSLMEEAYSRVRKLDEKEGRQGRRRESWSAKVR